MKFSFDRFSLDTLSERDQKAVKLGAVVVVLLVIFVVMGLDSRVSQAHARVTKKQADLVWMRGVAPYVAAVPVRPAGGGSGESLLVVVDRSAKESGLQKSVVGTEPTGPGSIQVRLEKASFDAIVGWLARLAEQNGLSVEGATIDIAGAPGIVNAAIVLHQQ